MTPTEALDQLREQFPGWHFRVSECVGYYSPWADAEPRMETQCAVIVTYPNLCLQAEALGVRNVPTLELAVRNVAMKIEAHEKGLTHG